MKLLVIEDDAKTVNFMQKGLSEEGFAVDVCRDGEDGLETAARSLHDLVILDVMMPKLDGWAVLSRLRELGATTPVLMLTARDSVEHRVKGLSLGADDYLVKPFAFAELVARIRSILRRSSALQSDVLAIGDLSLDLKRHRVQRGSQGIELTTKEMLLLSLMLRHQNEVLSRTFIAESVWNMDFDGDSNVVDVNIRRLRAKIDDPFKTKYIHTIRGRGYVLRE